MKEKEREEDERGRWKGDEGERERGRMGEEEDHLFNFTLPSSPGSKPMTNTLILSTVLYWTKGAANATQENSS